MTDITEKKKVRKPKTVRKVIRKKETVEISEEETNTIFSLENIIPSEVLFLHYGFGLTDDEDDEDIQETPIDIDGEDIGINEILHEKSKKSKRSIMFLDPHKCYIKYWGVMIDMTINGPLPRYTSKPCWYCRNRFASHPIGCPIKYHTSKEEGPSKERIEEVFSRLNLTIEDGTDFFETEGLFCTFPCVKSYILDELSRTKSPKYKKSLTHLTLLYKKIFGMITTIPAAPSWKLTEDWGGHLSPQEYRASTGMLEYVETINVKRPYMFCSSTLVRERRL